MLRVIKELQPTWVVGENVANFIRMELDDAVINLENTGYEVRAFNIPAVGIGAWHKRERVFIVAHTRYNARSTEQELQPEISKELIASSTGSICSKSSSNSLGFEWSQLWNLSGMGWSVEQIAWFANCIWESEPDVGRVVDGIPSKLDEFRRQRRCHALGNAVVPQQVYPILKAIADIEKGDVKNDG